MIYFIYYLHQLFIFTLLLILKQSPVKKTKLRELRIFVIFQITSPIGIFLFTII